MKAEAVVETLQQLLAHLVAGALFDLLVQPLVQQVQPADPLLGRAINLVADRQRQLGDVVGFEIGPFVYV